MSMNCSSQLCCFNDEDLLLFSTIVSHIALHTRPLLIPSLSNSSDVFIGATQILSSLRRETQTWLHLRSHTLDQNDAQHDATSKVFWSLVVAHTASFESRQHNAAMAWIVSALADSIIKFTTIIHTQRNARVLACIRLIQRVVRDNLSNGPAAAAEFLKSFHSNAQEGTVAVVEDISAAPSRWVGAAWSALQPLRNLIDCGCFSEVSLFLWKLATTVVQSLLAVSTPRGIFVDRVRICVLGAFPNNLEKKDDEETSDSNDDEENDDEEEEQHVAKKAVRFECDRIDGMQLPFELSTEARVVWNRLFRKQQQQQHRQENRLRVNVACFLCSLESLDDDDDDEISDGVGTNELEVTSLFDFCREYDVRLLCCQRVISHSLRTALARELNVMCVERLAITHFPILLNTLRNPVPLHVWPRYATGSQKSAAVATETFLTRDATSGKLWIRRENAAVRQQEQQRQQTPGVTTIRIVVPALIATTSASAIESTVRDSIRSVAQLVSDGVVIRLREADTYFVRSRSLAVSITTLVLTRVANLVEKNNEAVSSDVDVVIRKLAIQCARFLIDSLNRNGGEDAEQRISTSASLVEQQLLQKYPLCERLSAIRDALDSGFELAATLLSVSAVV